MRIMLTDRSEACAAVGAAMRRRGHEVLEACLPSAGRQHECVGLSQGSCPMRTGADLAVSGPVSAQDVASAGTVCARRAGVRVISVGDQDISHADLESMLVRAAAGGDEFVGWTVDQALHRTLADFGLPDGWVEVRHHTTGDQIRVTIPGPVDDRTRSRVAVRVLDAATSANRSGSRRDVIVRAI